MKSPYSLLVMKITLNECFCFCRYELFESSKRTTARRETTPQGFVPSYLQMVDYTANGCEMVVKYTVYIYTPPSVHITVNYIQHKTEVVIY